MSKNCIHSVPGNSMCPICEEIVIKPHVYNKFSKYNKKFKEFIRYLGIW